MQEIYLFTYLPPHFPKQREGLPENNNELSSRDSVWGQSWTGPGVDPVQNFCPGD